MALTFTAANGANFYWADSDNPPGRIPMCDEHQCWPCKICGTNHFEGCECSFCDPAGAAKLNLIPRRSADNGN